MACSDRRRREERERPRGDGREGPERRDDHDVSTPGLRRPTRRALGARLLHHRGGHAQTKPRCRCELRRRRQRGERGNRWPRREGWRRRRLHRRRSGEGGEVGDDGGRVVRIVDGGPVLHHRPLLDLEQTRCRDDLPYFPGCRACATEQGCHGLTRSGASCPSAPSAAWRLRAADRAHVRRGRPAWRARPPPGYRRGSAA